MTTYAQQLRDPRWQKRRLEILSRDEWQCVECGSKDSELHVHHIRYKYGMKPWDYGDNDLCTMCADCHSTHTAVTRDARDQLYDMLNQDLDETAEAISGLAALMFIGGARDMAALTEICHQAARASIARADPKRASAIFIDALFAMTDLAMEAERGKNQDA